MPALVLGDGAASFIHAFSETLKEKTRQFAEQADDRAYPEYSPWLCLRPQLKEPVEPGIVGLALPKGGLVVDPEQLNAIAGFLDGQGRPLAEGMPVALEQWPVMVNIAQDRPDAVSAFHEGRALLKCSPFLESVYDDLIECVIPQDREKPSGFDTALARGVVFRTFPQGRSGLLAGFQLAHAMGHQAAILLQAADPLIESDPGAQIHYLVRKDERSANHAMVSAVALGYMVVLMRSIYEGQRRPSIAEEHVSGYAAYLPDAVKLAIDSISDGCKLTRVGNNVLEELSTLAA